jgi:hypothetical protein
VCSLSGSEGGKAYPESEVKCGSFLPLPGSGDPTHPGLVALAPVSTSVVMQPPLLLCVSNLPPLTGTPVVTVRNFRVISAHILTLVTSAKSFGTIPDSRDWVVGILEGTGDLIPACHSMRPRHLPGWVITSDPCWWPWLKTSFQCEPESLSTRRTLQGSGAPRRLSNHDQTSSLPGDQRTVTKDENATVQ